MFTFRRLTLLFFIILITLVLLNILPGMVDKTFFRTHAAWLSGLLILLFLGISVAMAFLPCSGFHHPATCRGKTDEKAVAVTFDDGPDPVKTPLVLDTLKKHRVKAAFFCIGKKLTGCEQLIRRMDEEGHVLGNHSFCHSAWFDLLPAGRIRAELMRTDQSIRDITGKTPLFFRPPYGVINPPVSNALNKMHWRVICWTIRSFDTRNSNPQKTRQKILRQLQPGSVILLHDHTAFTEHHLEGLLQGIRDAGYRFVSLDELLAMPAYRTG